MDQELWFRVKVGLRDSDGARVLERRLDDPRAYTYVPDLWDWFVQRHPEGRVVGPDAAFLIARGSGWAGDVDRFCAAMVAAGFLEAVTEGFRVKGWEKWAGYHLKIRSEGAERKRTSRVGPPDVPVTSRGQTPENGAGNAACPRDPSPLSDLSSSRGVQGGRRARLSSPFPPGQDPHPLTSAVLAALWDRGVTRASPPAAKSAGKVEAAIRFATVPVAVERLEAVYADSAAKEPLTYHTDAIQGNAPPRRTHGDLGVELRPWRDRLTLEERRAGAEEIHALASIDPDLENAPLGIAGNPESPAYERLREITERYRRIAETRA